MLRRAEGNVGEPAHLDSRLGTENGQNAPNEDRVERRQHTGLYKELPRQRKVVNRNVTEEKKPARVSLSDARALTFLSAAE